MSTQDNTQVDIESGTDKNEDAKSELKMDNWRVEKKREPEIPPPFPLLPKSQLPSEPIRTGAPIPFLKLTYLKGGSNLLVEKQ